MCSKQVQQEATPTDIYYYSNNEKVGRLGYLKGGISFGQPGQNLDQNDDMFHEIIFQDFSSGCCFKH